MKTIMVNTGSKINLAKIDPDDTSGFAQGKDEGGSQLDELIAKLDGLQELLYAEHKHAILVVLQAMDTGGKDGTIRKVFEGVNPQGVRVASFKVPTPLEGDHDYLWRIHQPLPAKGEIVVFNRSHYENVLVVRVHNLVPEEQWKKRFEHINQFEKMLVDEGTTILKFFLHITRDEQKKRLEERLADPAKQWKFSPADLEERKLWDDYQFAYEEMINKTSTDWAPWTVVPANHNWYRNLMVANSIVKALEDLKMQLPKPTFDPKAIKID